MSPQERGRLHLARLVGEVRADQAALARLARRVRELAPAPDADAADVPDERMLALAALLQHYYTGLETLLVRVVRAFEEREPEGPSWHLDLLREAGRPLGPRPRILCAESVRLLRKLLGFRHFFRHAYGVDLEWRELRLRVEDLRSVHPLVEEDMEALCSALDAAIGTEDGGV